jgi:transcriptional regulator with XRE-family HTH domain
VVSATVTNLRTSVRWSQRELSRRSGIPQSTISRIERARLKDPSLAAISALIDALGGRLRIEIDQPFLGERRQQVDAAHSRMSGFVARRLEGHGWRVATEVEVGGNRSRGWIDLMAFQASTGRVLLIEIKTEIHDLGRIDRTMGWYEREAWAAARRLAWRPTGVTGCLLLLATRQNDINVRQNRESLDRLFPSRAQILTAMVRGHTVIEPRGARAMAMIDPRSRRRSWIRPTSIDGRRTAAPYVDYADFMRRIRHR